MPRLLALQHRPHAQLWINVLPERPELLLLADETDDLSAIEGEALVVIDGAEGGIQIVPTHPADALSEIPKPLPIALDMLCPRSKNELGID